MLKVNLRTEGKIKAFSVQADAVALVVLGPSLIVLIELVAKLITG